MAEETGPGGLRRRRLLAGLSTGVLGGAAGCNALLDLVDCRDGYTVDGEQFALTEFPRVELAPMDADPPELVVDFEVPGGQGVSTRNSGSTYVTTIEYGCENKNQGRGNGCACSTLSLVLDAGGGTYPRPLVPGEYHPAGTNYQPTDRTIEYEGRDLHVWRTTIDWAGDWTDWSTTRYLTLMVAFPFEAEGETLYAETPLTTMVGIDPQVLPTMPDARRAVEAGTYRILGTATPDPDFDRSGVDRQSGRTPG